MSYGRFHLSVVWRSEIVQVMASTSLFGSLLLELSGSRWPILGLIGSTDTNNYSGGTQILAGVIPPHNDLWFQEGSRNQGCYLFLAVGLAWLAPRLGAFNKRPIS